MIVKLTQDLARGFKPWKDMFHENEAALNALGGKLIFAGTEKDNDNKLMVIIDFESPEAMKAFGGHEELKAKRAAAGAILETTVITPMSGESFTRWRKENGVKITVLIHYFSTQIIQITTKEARSICH